MTAYYNENDQYAAAWLRELIKADQIAPGDVDERSIVEVQPDDLRGYTQCHFFAGIGGWSYALRLANVPDDEPIWTGSCPCQPLSGAGQRKGHADERHLWPAFHRLIAECRPATIFGEQVASKDGREWLAGVRADLEALGYAVGAADLCAASVRAPHIRQRLYWLADADGRVTSDGDLQRRGQHGHQPQDGGAGGMGNAMREPSKLNTGELSASQARECRTGSVNGDRIDGPQHAGEGVDAWANASNIYCLDGKSRRVEPGIFPLVARLPRGVVPSGDPDSPDHANATAEARMMRLRGYGNAINPVLAAEFIRCARKATPLHSKHREVERE